MKGKNIFTKGEAEEICKLIEKKVHAKDNEQKSIRKKIRSLGFHIEDFSTDKGYTVADFKRYVTIIK